MPRPNKQLIEGLLWVQNKRQERVKFRLNPVQALFESRRTGRDIILKARQKGLSTYILADQFIDCLRSPTNAVVVSHESEATQRLFSKIKYFRANLPMEIATEYDTKQSIYFSKTGSSFYIGTAGSKAFGRGDTLHRVHASEVAFWHKADEVMLGLKEAASTGRIVIESTANGRTGWFYDEWRKAMDGESIYTPHFIPWYVDTEYTDNFFTEEERGRFPSHVVEMLRSPELTLTEEEEFLQEKAKRYGFTLTLGHFKWRRVKLWDIGEKFYQEYPEDDVSCFLQSGRPVFKTLKMERPGSLVEGREYVGGIDGAEGLEGGDRHCFAVIDHKVSPAKVVFEMVSNDPIDIFATQVSAICKKYRIKLFVEKNGVGVAHCLKLKQLGVNFKEWETTASSRPVMIVELEEAYRKEELVETYPEAQNELMDMYYDENNRPVHPKGKHDDRVFARAMAWQARKQPEFNIRW